MLVKEIILLVTYIFVLLKELGDPINVLIIKKVYIFEMYIN